MDEYGKNKLLQYKNIFSTLKILIIFFCAIPLFEYCFSDSTYNTFYSINGKAILTSIAIILIVAFLWFVMDINYKKKSNRKWHLYVELFIFYIMCTVAVVLSGGYKSYYKFIFIFIIVTYTIEYGLKMGFTLSIASSAILLATDIVLYNGSGVNPYFQNDLALSAMFVVVAWVLGFYVNTEKCHIENLKKIANIDGLTGLYNHRFFHETLKKLCTESEKTQSPVSLIIGDIDYFKPYNDILGHQSGDVLLKQIAEIITSSIGEAGSIYRYGGDEFCIILDDTSEDVAELIASKLRLDISKHSFPGTDKIYSHKITMSMGISQFNAQSDDSYMELIARADKALYKAKYLRKDRIERYYNIFDQFNDGHKNDLFSNTNVKSLISIINSRDMYTFTHTERVVYFCNLFADYTKMPVDEKKKLIYSAYLHDMGKINVSKDILISDRKLTPQEWDELKEHPVDSAEIVRQLGGMDDIAEIVKHHHERYDGGGYPDGLSGEKIPYLSRVLTVVDSFDAMTNTRPYQHKKTIDQAISELKHCEGTQFDADIAEVFIDSVNQF